MEGGLPRGAHPTRPPENGKGGVEPRPPRTEPSERLRLCRGRVDVHEGAVTALLLERHHAVDEREEGVVFAAADVVAGCEHRAALADEDRAAVDLLAPEPLYPEVLRVRVAAVPGAALTFLVCHLAARFSLRARCPGCAPAADSAGAPWCGDNPCGASS